MGYLKSLGSTFVWISTILAAITFIPGLPPYVNFSPYEFKLPVEIVRQPNDKLNGAEKLFDGKIKGPEAFDSYNGVLYTALHGGAVSKLVDDKLVEVVKFGKKCDGIWEEDKCGRPLGLKFDKQGRLYVVDAYYGIFNVDVATGKFEKIIDISEAIDGKVPMLPNSIDVADNGDLFWTISSTDFKLYDGLLTMLCNPSGRLIRYNARTKQNQVLLENLAFANGLKLSDDESFVIVAETTTSRIVKYHLKGPQAGKSEIFIEGLPGIPDNIHSDGYGNFLVSLISIADEEHPQLLQSLAPHPNIRKMIVRTLTLLEAPFKFLDQVYPNYYFKRIAHWFGHFESVHGVMSPAFVILRIDPTGKILDIMESTDDRIVGISSAFPLGNYLYLGSPFNEYLARVPLDKALPDLKYNIKSEQPVVRQAPIPPVVKEQAQQNRAEVPTTTERSPSPPPTATTPMPTTLPPPSPTNTPDLPTTVPVPAHIPEITIKPIEIPVNTKPIEKPVVIQPVEKPQVVQQPTKQFLRDEM